MACLTGRYRGIQCESTFSTFNTELQFSKSEHLGNLIQISSLRALFVGFILLSKNLIYAGIPTI